MLSELFMGVYWRPCMRFQAPEGEVRVSTDDENDELEDNKDAEDRVRNVAADGGEEIIGFGRGEVGDGKGDAMMGEDEDSVSDAGHVPEKYCSSSHTST